MKPWGTASLYIKLLLLNIQLHSVKDIVYYNIKLATSFITYLAILLILVILQQLQKVRL